MGVYGEAGDDGLDRGGQYHRVGCLLHEGSRMEGENKELKHLALEAERRRLFLITGDIHLKNTKPNLPSVSQVLAHLQ